MEKTLGIIRHDPWLEPYSEAIKGRHEDAVRKEAELVGKGGNLVDFANAHQYFGLHKTKTGWVFREWAPNATAIYLIGTFNGWKESDEYKLKPIGNGAWEITLPKEAMKHGDLYKLMMHWDGGCGERIPAYSTRTVQDEKTLIFSAQVWFPPRKYKFKVENFKPQTNPLLIYECHIGMAQERRGIGTYDEFTDLILPRIKQAGYTAVQLMAIAEHPYYGSFGYHVSNFFAPSSRFGTPEQLKRLVDTAHGMGLAVIMDLVHAHYVKNINEGINALDGSAHLYSKAGAEGYQQYWDSMTFDYGKGGVEHFLLSNVKYWLDRFHFDGYRFDGVTSMIYHHHGYVDFDCRDRYFDEGVNLDALTYLTLANRLVHDFRPASVTIAEEVSGMPGICFPPYDGGVGFDYRLGMAIPDFWIKMLKDTPDEDWNIWEMWSVMTDRLPGVKTVAYAESHDQALVGDKTIAFRLMDRLMYDSMDRKTQNILIDRGMALHKMIRLMTITTGGEAYLNFMGNEFGHPEWIDFPREGNGWSYDHARRQWSLRDSKELRYSFLADFDREMLLMVRRYGILADGYPYNLLMDEHNKTIVFAHGDLVFIFNWHPTASIPDYELPVRREGRYVPLLSTDEARFGGLARQAMDDEHFSFPVGEDAQPHIRIYNTSRTAIVLRRCDD